MAQVAQLLRLPGNRPVSSQTFVMEFFGWRRFRNRREDAALAGLPPTPCDSGNRLREQGISKAGNRLVLTLAIEILARHEVERLGGNIPCVLSISP